jgi:hypothetical protein
MNRRLSAGLIAALLAMPAYAQAQVPDWVTQILSAAQLPVAATAARNDGVGNADMRAILDALLNNGVPAYEATAIIDTTRKVHREHGPVDNFGAFVQTQLAAGKRGRELAAAIRQEHARMGKGKPGRGASGDKVGRGRSGDNPGRGRGRPPGA